MVGKKFVQGLVAIAALVAVSGSVLAADKIKAVATFSILGDMVGRVGGDRVDVKTLVGPEGDAHVFQPTPADAAELTRAQVVFQNGLGFEGWMDRLIKSAGYKGKSVVASKGVMALTAPEEQEHEHENEHGQDHGDTDPHAWHNLANGLIYVKNIKEGLCKVDSDGCATYTRNANEYSAEIKKLETEIKTKLAVIPTAQRKVITDHDAFGYFASAYGIEFLAPRGVSTESEASAKDVAKLVDQVKKEQVKALFFENVSDARLLEQIGRETGVKPGGTLYSDALSKAGGPASSYLDMVRYNASLIAGAMVGS